MSAKKYPGRFGERPGFHEKIYYFTIRLLMKNNSLFRSKLQFFLFLDFLKSNYFISKTHKIQKGYSKNKKKFIYLFFFMFERINRANGRLKQIQESAHYELKNE